MENYIPKNPYVLKSGKNQGKALEQLLISKINDFLVLKTHADMHKNKKNINQQQAHLLWLVEKVDQLIDKVTCECGQKAVSLPVTGNSQEGFKTYIPKALCESCQKNYEWSNYSIAKLSPWSLIKHRTANTQKNAWKAMKEILDISRFNYKQLFKLFTSDQ